MTNPNMNSCDCPYGILGVSKASSESEIRKQYLKKCREFHPDKNSDQDGLGFIKIKAAYDRLTGKDSGLDGLVGAGETDWASLWKLSMDDILKFEKEYRESEEEKKDILQAYLDHKGDIQAIIDHVLCARIEDEERFIKLIEHEIEAGSLEKSKKFTKDCSTQAKNKRKRAADVEAQEAEELAEELGLNDLKSKGRSGPKQNGSAVDQSDEDALAIMIKYRAQSRFDAMIANLESKYGSKASSSSSKSKTKKSTKKKV